MFECFLEIGFEAELNTKEDPELMELAYEQCKENLATRATAITELRQMIFDRGECHPIRTDDEYMLRFLRAREFIVPRAHKLVGRWDPSEYPVEDLLRAGMAMTEIGIRQPKLQILAGTVIVDLEGLTLRHVAALTPTVAYQIVCLMGLAVPARLKGIHIINYSWILNTFFYIFKKFIPQQAWQYIHFHGNDLKSLQKHLDLECLPPRYGGKCRAGANFGVWLQKIKKYRDEQFDKEMKQLGYVIKE
ncbi:hypothetical protein HF086_014951 [Spodoptera exigua]|uniref:CRAL-TRIO domain-containing protein n=1 Tax=Spodoptera exigua TaxID=7107 RepID=A0A922SHQ3_SPOEX|nr:hypothetical protein HF086_014951 [Spodoptera exigua]